MVHLVDRRKLSAPVEALRAELTEAYKRLDAKWDEIARCLKSLSIPSDVFYEYVRHDSDCKCLVWKKWNGKKRICIELHVLVENSPSSGITTTPYEEWSDEQRIEMLQHVPGLFASAEEQIKMVNLELRKLSAPIEALRPELTEAYKRLDTKWDEIARCLKSLPIPSSPVVSIYDQDGSYPDCACLVWKKWNGKKRICIEVRTYDQPTQSNTIDKCSNVKVNTTPYEEWSSEKRIEMLQHVPSLFTSAEKQTKEFIDKVNEALGDHDAPY